MTFRHCDGLEEPPNVRAYRRAVDWRGLCHSRNGRDKLGASVCSALLAGMLA